MLAKSTFISISHDQTVILHAERKSKLVLQGKADSFILTSYSQRLIFLFHLKLK